MRDYPDACEVWEFVDPNEEEGIFRCYQELLSSGTTCDAKVEATVKLARRVELLPEDVLSRAVHVLVTTVIGAIGDDPSRPVVEASVYCLSRIALVGGGKSALEIGQSGVIGQLMRLIPDASTCFRLVLMKCIRNLVVPARRNRVLVARNSGLEMVIGMLGRPRVDDNIRKYLLEILSALALLREARRSIGSLGGLRYLIEAASSGGISSRERACQAIGLLGLNRPTRQMMIQMGVVPVLVDLFCQGDLKAKAVAGNTLGLMSADIDSVKSVARAGAIPLYAELLHGSDPTGNEIAEDALCLLAFDEEHAAEVVDNLVRTLREGENESKGVAADILWDVASYKHLVPIVKNSGAIQILVELLRNGSVEVREKVSMTIAQMTDNKVYRVGLIDAGAVGLLTELLYSELDELRDNAAEALVNFFCDEEQRDLVSEVVGNRPFQIMLSRLNLIQAAAGHVGRSFRRMSIDQINEDSEEV